MPVLLLLFLTLACLPDKWPVPAWIASPLVSAALTWTGVALEVLLAAIVSHRTKHAFHAGRESRERTLRRYLRGRWIHTLGLFLTYGLALYAFGYGWAVQSFWSSDDIPLPGTEVLLLAPFFASLILSWACFHSAERAFWNDSADADGPPRQFFSRRAFVWFHLRQNLALVFLPVILLAASKEARRLFPALMKSWEVQVSIAGGILVFIVFVTMPWIIRFVLGLERLPDGPMRQRLLATAERLNFRCSDILLWNTRGGIANAMVVGIVPQIRYVLLTDRLLDELTPDEVEAVFGHEVGHIKHYHILYYLTFLLTSMAVLSVLLLPWEKQIEDLLHFETRGDLAVIPAVVALGLYIFLVFGFLSRRCERQADIYGCRAVSCGASDCAGHPPSEEMTYRGQVLCPTGIDTFIQALEKVAVLNGLNRDKPGFLQSWQHSTIARRVAFLRTLVTDPQAEPRFQRRVFLVKCGLFAVLGVLFLWQVV
jgi:Zn-dependent protease with chaperone function